MKFTNLSLELAHKFKCLCNPDPYPICNVTNTSESSCIPLPHQSLLSLPVVITILIFPLLKVNSSCFKMSHKWNCKVCILLIGSSSTQNVLEIHPRYCVIAKQLVPFLLVSTIPLNDDTTVYLVSYGWMPGLFLVLAKRGKFL